MGDDNLKTWVSDKLMSLLGYSQTIVLYQKQEREVVLARTQKTYQLLDADDDHEYDGAGGIDNKSLIAYASDRHKKWFRKKIESEDEVECLHSSC
ncbi:hypothetical protein OIU78_029655 [Salix suchowensis]|nr:hypothetical protein OIU78_029655 [Salix suchowensis]